MDPAGALPGYTGPVGPDPAVMKFFNTYPLPNDLSQGDGFNTAGFRFAAPTHEYEELVHREDGLQHYERWKAASVAERVDGHRKSGRCAVPTRRLTDDGPGELQQRFDRELHGDAEEHADQQLPVWIHPRKHRNDREHGSDVEHVSGIDPSFGSTLNYSSEFQRPINTFWDDLNWTHGKHSLQFGFQASLIRNPTSSSTSSFSNGYTNAQWLNTSGLAGRDSSPLNPANNGFPAVDFNGFGTNYDNAVTALLGMDVEVNAQYNYARDGSVLAQGAPVVRHYAENGFEMYAQDVWKVKPSLTVTMGLRYSLFSPPWETNGLEVTPTESLNTWFNDRGTGMNNGVPSIASPPVAFNFSGPANGGTTGILQLGLEGSGAAAGSGVVAGIRFGAAARFVWRPGERAASARDSESCMTGSARDC